jgi:hypothetical protein
MKRIFTRATDARALFSKSKETAGKRPLTLIIDGAQNYVRGVQARVLHEPQSSVSPCQGHQARRQVHDNKIERMNGEVRDRGKIMRGINKMDTPILKGTQIFHTYTKPQEDFRGGLPLKPQESKSGARTND